MKLEEQHQQVNEPSIITDNTYNWTPSRSASIRRSNEARAILSVGKWLNSLEFKTLASSEFCSGELQYAGNKYEVRFEYSETTSNVYKRFKVVVNDKISNVKALRNLKKIQDATYYMRSVLAANTDGKVPGLADSIAENLKICRKALTADEITALKAIIKKQQL